MTNYEIMLILDPKEEQKNIETFLNEVFKDYKLEKLDRTELAYEINHSKTATYLVIDVKTSSEKISEFSRRSNISKTIWRYLVINLDSEKGREKELERQKRFESRRREKENQEVDK